MGHFVLHKKKLSVYCFPGEDKFLLDLILSHRDNHTFLGYPCHKYCEKLCCHIIFFSRQNRINQLASSILGHIKSVSTFNNIGIPTLIMDISVSFFRNDLYANNLSFTLEWWCISKLLPVQKHFCVDVLLMDDNGCNRKRKHNHGNFMQIHK